MKKIASLILFLYAFIFHNVHAMELLENCLTCRRATLFDIVSLLELINKEVSQEADTLVVVPKVFRANKLQKEIEDGKILVALVNDTIVGFKKMYLVTDPDERHSILSDEIRCVGKEPESTVFVGSISENEQQEAFVEAVCIYNGGDFTCESYRRKGINAALTNYALTQLKKQIKTPQYCMMVYGLTHHTSGTDILGGRTKSISSCFKDFLKNSSSSEEPSLKIQRYKAFKPSFDPDSTELKSLDDNYSVEGFGYVMLGLLKNNTAQ